MDPIGDTGIDERHDFSARSGPVVIDDHSGTRFSQMRLRSDSGNDGKYVGKSMDTRFRKGPHDYRDLPTTQTPSRGAQADLRGKQRESPQPESQIKDLSDIDSLPEAYSVQRGQGEDSLQLTRNPVAPQGSNIFSAIKSAMLGVIIPREKATDLYNNLCSGVRNLRDEADHFRSENHALKDYCNALHDEVQQHREDYESLLSELQRVHQELENSRHLADVRGKELLGAQVFLTTADILSVSEITQKVIELNDEIFQAAALLTESLNHKVASGTEDEKNTFLKFTLSILGRFMFDAITNSLGGGKINPILVQLSLQTYLAQFCCEKLDKWYEKDENTNKFLVNIYKEISYTEEQSVSGRWRAITHANTRLETDNWAFEFNIGLNNILRAASVAPDDPDSLPAFEQKLDPIFRAIINLRIALREQFTSADITPFVVTSGTAFKAESMEDGLSDVRSSGRGKKPKVKSLLERANMIDIVVSTVGIGLKQWAPHPTFKASKEEDLILMPKVVLQSTLTDFLRPSPFR